MAPRAVVGHKVQRVFSDKTAKGPIYQELDVTLNSLESNQRKDHHAQADTEAILEDPRKWRQRHCNTPQ